MSNTKKIAKKTVKISENDLVDLMDNILNEAIAIKKKEWLTEQAAKDEKKTLMFEQRISALEKLISKK